MLSVHEEKLLADKIKENFLDGNFEPNVFEATIEELVIMFNCPKKFLYEVSKLIVEELFMKCIDARTAIEKLQFTTQNPKSDAQKIA